MENVTTETLKKVIFLKDYKEISVCLKDEKNQDIIKDIIENEKKKNIELSDDVAYKELEETIYKELENISNENICILDKRGIADKGDLAIVHNFAGKKMMGPYVGFLRTKIKGYDCTIILESRFDNNNNNFFTNYILNKALEMKSIIFPNMNVPLEQSNIMEILMAIIFVRQMEKAYKKGLFRQYRTYENNDMKVKGKIDISRHIKLNPLFNGKMAYSYREYTADNDINRIILTAYEMLNKKNKQWMNELTKKYHVDDCIKQLKNITSAADRQEIQAILRKNKKKIHHSIYKDWESVRKTAIMILKHLGVHINDSNNTEINGVLIDMPSIWEGYLEKIFQENSLQFKTQVEKYAILDEKNKGKRKLRPDFFYESNGQEKSKNRIVLDAKYKEKWGEVIRTGNWDDVREDVFQVMSYMYALKAATGGIVCPFNGELDSYKNNVKREGYKISEEIEDRFYVLPLLVSKAEKKEEFFEEMKEKEEKLAKEVAELQEI